MGRKDIISDVAIRSAEECDFVQLINLFKEFAAFEKMPKKMTNSVERMAVEKDFFNCFVAETEEREIVGYVTWFFCYYTWTGKSAYMDDLYVKPVFRGRKVGTSLLLRVIEQAKNSGCLRLRWQVSNWNTPAREFYKSIGAEISDVEQNCDLYLNR